MITFTYNNILGSTYGCYLTDRPEIKAAKMDSQTEAVPGRGEVTLINGGHADVSVDVSAFVRQASNVDNVIKWLSSDGGYHPFVLSYDPSRCRSARVDGEIVVEHVGRTMSARQLTIPMRMKPYWYETVPSSITAVVGDNTLVNTGNMPAAPLISLTGAGDATITIGAQTLSITDMPLSLVIDCDAKTAYTVSGGIYVLASGHTNGDWLTIPTGESTMTITGSGLSTITIQPRWRWL